MKIFGFNPLFQSSQIFIFSVTCCDFTAELITGGEK